MAFYQYSWLILLAPLFSFAVIIFGTRVWDLLSRPRAAVATTHEEEHAAPAHGSEGDDHSEDGLDDDEDPKVARLTAGATWSGYIAILLLAVACVYSWLLLLNTAGAIHIAPPLPPQGITVLSYDWFVQPGGIASYTITFHLDTLAIAMMVVVTTISLLVHF
jgi:NADH-quinone oxidoreductase subunit L